MLKWAVVIISCAIAWRWMSPKTPLTKERLLEEYDYVIGNSQSPLSGQTLIVGMIIHLRSTISSIVSRLVG